MRRSLRCQRAPKSLARRHSSLRQGNATQTCHDLGRHHSREPNINLVADKPGHVAVVHLRKVGELCRSCIEMRGDDLCGLRCSAQGAVEDCIDPAPFENACNGVGLRFATDGQR